MSIVGTPAILHHPLVEEAPPRINRPVPVPSVYQDGRGEIHNFAISQFRVNLLSTKAGVLRSGDVHDSVQHDFVFSGKVRVWILVQKEVTTTATTTTMEDIISNPSPATAECSSSDKTHQSSIKDSNDDANNASFSTIKTTYGSGDYITIPPYTPHIFEFLTDAVLAEWWDGPFRAWFYKPYRQLVTESLAATQGRPGVLYQYHVMASNTSQQEPSFRSSSSSWTHLLAVAGLGIFTGYLFGRRSRN